MRCRKLSPPYSTASSPPSTSNKTTRERNSAGLRQLLYRGPKIEKDIQAHYGPFDWQTFSESQLMAYRYPIYLKILNLNKIFTCLMTEIGLSVSRDTVCLS